MKNFRTDLVNRINGVWWVFFGTWLILHGESMKLADPVRWSQQVVGVDVGYWQYIVSIIVVGVLSFIPQFGWNWFQAVILKQTHTAEDENSELKRAWTAGGVTAVIFIPVLYFYKVGDWMYITALYLIAANIVLWGVPALYKRITKK